MSDLSKVLEALNVELAHYKAQRDQLQINLQQAVGAIFAAEKAIEKLLDVGKEEAQPAAAGTSAAEKEDQVSA